MEISRYLAMTPKEMEVFSLPEGFGAACMACRFSPGGLGLSNIPQQLPLGSMLILSDQTPISGHDPGLILEQLSDVMSRLGCCGLLLDLEREPEAETMALCRLLAENLPVGIPAAYASELKCPVFLPPCPPDKPLKEYLSPWKDREIWLDVAIEMQLLELSEQGCTPLPCPWLPVPDDAFTDERLHCRYRAQLLEDKVRFHLWRDQAMTEALIREAENLGIPKAIGLFQEWNTTTVFPVGR